MYPIWTAIFVSSVGLGTGAKVVVPTYQRGGRGVCFEQPILRSAYSKASMHPIDSHAHQSDPWLRRW